MLSRVSLGAALLAGPVVLYHERIGKGRFGPMEIDYLMPGAHTVASSMFAATFLLENRLSRWALSAILPARATAPLPLKIAFPLGVAVRVFVTAAGFFEVLPFYSWSEFGEKIEEFLTYFLVMAVFSVAVAIGAPFCRMTSLVPGTGCSPNEKGGNYDDRGI